MIKGILMLVFLGIIAAVIHSFPIEAPFSWIISLVLIMCALYVVAVMFGLVQAPWYNNRTGPPL